MQLSHASQFPGVGLRWGGGEVEALQSVYPYASSLIPSAIQQLALDWLGNTTTWSSQTCYTQIWLLWQEEWGLSFIRSSSISSVGTHTGQQAAGGKGACPYTISQHPLVIWGGCFSVSQCAGAAPGGSLTLNAAALPITKHKVEQPSAGW